MAFACYACGFNGLQQVDFSDNELKEEWVMVADGVNKKQCVSMSWDSLYLEDAEGRMLKNGCLLAEMDGKDEQMPLMLSAAEDRLLALYSDGTVWLHSDTGWRALRLQSAADETSPGTVTDISIGRHTLAACDSAGRLLTLDAVPTPAGERVRSVSCGREHVVLLTQSGRVFSYGGGSRGQLGTGELSSVEQLQLVKALDGLKICQVSAGGWHTAALSDAGDVYTWGWNEANQLGLGEEVNVAPEPALVESLSADTRVCQLACGTRHTLALLEDGAVFGWGWNGYGQLAAAVCERTPPHVLPVPAAAGRVARIAAGGWGSVLVMSN